MIVSDWPEMVIASENVMSSSIVISSYEFTALERSAYVVTEVDSESFLDATGGWGVAFTRTGQQTTTTADRNFQAEFFSFIYAEGSRSLSGVKGCRQVPALGAEKNPLLSARVVSAWSVGGRQ